MDLELTLYTDLIHKRKKIMTNKLFFDTDCISSFLWVKEENILIKLYPGRIVLPKLASNTVSFFIHEGISIKPMIISITSSKISFGAFSKKEAFLAEISKDLACSHIITPVVFALSSSKT